MSEDLIRRSDAIKAIEAEECLGYVECQSEWLYDRINAIPSADRPQGNWILFPMGYLVCSVCGSHHSNSKPCNYCDNCGAKMKGADDE